MIFLTIIKSVFPTFTVKIGNLVISLHEIKFEILKSTTITDDHTDC